MTGLALMEQLLCEKIAAAFLRLQQRTFGNSHFNRSGAQAPSLGSAGKTDKSAGNKKGSLSCLFY